MGGVICLLMKGEYPRTSAVVSTACGPGKLAPSGAGETFTKKWSSSSGPLEEVLIVRATRSASKALAACKAASASHHRDIAGSLDHDDPPDPSPARNGPQAEVR